MSSSAQPLQLFLADIASVADKRPPGYVEAIMAAGKKVDDRLEIDSAELDRIKRRFGTGTEPPMGGCQGCGG